MMSPAVETLTRHSRESGNPAGDRRKAVRAEMSHWIPAFAGMTVTTVKHD
jgi:hypothetical protein